MREREQYKFTDIGIVYVIGVVFLLLFLFGLWTMYTKGGKAESNRLAPGTYHVDVSMGTGVGQFSITSLQVDPANTVRLTGLYRNTTDQSVVLSCADGAGGNIRFSDGTSLNAVSHTCTGHEGQQFKVDPGKTIGQYLVFPSNKELIAVLLSA